MLIQLNINNEKLANYCLWHYFTLKIIKVFSKSRKVNTGNLSDI